MLAVGADENAKEILIFEERKPQAILLTLWHKFGGILIPNFVSIKFIWIKCVN